MQWLHTDCLAFHSRSSIESCCSLTHIFPILFVSTTWMQSNTWTYGPGHYFRTLPAMVSRAQRKAWASYMDETHESLKIWRERNVKTRKLPSFISAMWLWYDDETTVASGIKQHRWKQVTSSNSKVSRVQSSFIDAKLALRVPRCQRALLALAIAVTWIYDNEKTIKINLTQSANDWGFGQIASMVLSVPAAASLVQLLLRIGSPDKSVVT